MLHSIYYFIDFLIINKRYSTFFFIQQSRKKSCLGSRKEAFREDRDRDFLSPLFQFRFQFQVGPGWYLHWIPTVCKYVRTRTSTRCRACKCLYVRRQDPKHTPYRPGWEICATPFDRRENVGLHKLRSTRTVAVLYSKRKL